MKSVERYDEDIGEEIRKLFDGEPVGPDGLESYNFLQVQPINGDKRVPKGLFAVRENDGIVYRVSGQVGRSLILQDVPESTQKVVYDLADRLKEGQQTDGHYVWTEANVAREARATQLDPDNCRVKIEFPRRYR